MRKKITHNKLLGVTQLDMAMLLLVSPSQYSMFESGQRSLPMHSVLLLTDMLASVAAAEKVDGGQRIPSEAQLKEHQQHLESSLRDNEYEQLKIAKKIAALEQKIVTQLRLSRLVGFFDNRIKEKAERWDKIHESFVNVSRDTLKTVYMSPMSDLLRKQKMLKLEQTCLAEELLNYNDK